MVVVASILLLPVKLSHVDLVHVDKSRPPRFHFTTKRLRHFVVSRSHVMFVGFPSSAGSHPGDMRGR